MNQYDKDDNVLPNTFSSSSENPSLFNVTYTLLREQGYHFYGVEGIGEETLIMDYLKELNMRKWKTNNGRYMTNDNDYKKFLNWQALENGRNPDRFSLDEAIAVAASSRRYEHYENLSKIELFGRSYGLRPDTFSFLLLCKYPIFNLLIIPRLFVSLSMIIACMRKPSDTSGKQLAYIRYKGLDMKWTWSLCMKLLTNESLLDVFRIYYPDKKSLIRITAERTLS